MELYQPLSLALFGPFHALWFSRVGNLSHPHTLISENLTVLSLLSERAPQPEQEISGCLCWSAMSTPSAFRVVLQGLRLCPSFIV